MASFKEEKLEENVVLFSRENTANIEEVWDDTALIRAYEKSVRKIKKAIKSKNHTLDQNDDLNKTDNAVSEKISKKENLNEQEKFETESDSNLEIEWKEGDLCSAIYTEDNLLYPATITKIFKDKKNADKCKIKYLYYLNEEEKYLNELYEYEELEAGLEDDDEDDIEENTYVETSTSSRNFEKSKITSNKKDDFFTDALPNMPVPPMLPYELMSRLSLKKSDKIKNKKNKNIDEQEDENILNSMLMSWYMSGYHTGFYYGLNHCKKRFN